MTNAFPDRIQLDEGHNTHGIRWFATMTPFRQHSSIGTFTVPAGFLTDGASIPRIFWPIIGPFGIYFGAALIHDFLYSKRGGRHYPDLTRKQADEVFKEGMYNLGVPWHHRHAMYRAVRMFGWRSYQKR